MSNPYCWCCRSKLLIFIPSTVKSTLLPVNCQAECLQKFHRFKCLPPSGHSIYYTHFQKKCTLFSSCSPADPGSQTPVAANHKNDTCFGNRLVMGSADCINYAGLVKGAQTCNSTIFGPVLKGSGDPLWSLF